MSNTAIRVRPVRLSDGDAVFGLLTQFAVSYQPERGIFDRHFLLLLETSSADFLAAESDGAVIGYVLAFTLLTLYANGAIVEIQELMVAPAQRGQGLGRALVEAVIERAGQRGAVEVTVPTRRAGDYYRKLGFVETASYFKRKL